MDQLLKFSARPRDLLAARTQGLRQQQLAVTELAALVIGVELSVQQLNGSRLFQQKTITSSHPELVTAVSTGSPPAGSFDITPIREATSHQLLSSGLTLVIHCASGL